MFLHSARESDLLWCSSTFLPRITDLFSESWGKEGAKSDCSHHFFTSIILRVTAKTNQHRDREWVQRGRRYCYCFYCALCLGQQDGKLKSWKTEKKSAEFSQSVCVSVKLYTWLKESYMMWELKVFWFVSRKCFFFVNLFFVFHCNVILSKQQREVKCSKAMDHSTFPMLLNELHNSVSAQSAFPCL